MLTVVIAEKSKQSGGCVAYQIEYFSNGMMVGRVPCPKSLQDTRLNAQRGLKLHRAEFAKIIDTKKNKLVEVVKPDA